MGSDWGIHLEIIQSGFLAQLHVRGFISFTDPFVWRVKGMIKDKWASLGHPSVVFCLLISEVLCACDIFSIQYQHQKFIAKSSGMVRDCWQNEYPDFVAYKTSEGK